MPRLTPTRAESEAAQRRSRWLLLARELTHRDSTDPVAIHRLGGLLLREAVAPGVDPDDVRRAPDGALGDVPATAWEAKR